MANKTAVTSGRNGMITLPLQYTRRLPSPNGTSNTKAKQTGPQAQSPPRPTPSPVLGQFLHLARR
jgi:hypothetical protein